MKTPLQELIDDVHRWGEGLDYEELYQRTIRRAFELLEKERAEILNAYFEGKMDSVRENRGHMIAELYFKERYNQNKYNEI